MQRFSLAPMSALFRLLTLLLWCLPVGFFGASLQGVAPMLFVPAIFLLLIYLLVWLWFRPTAFVVTDTALTDASLTVMWPLRRRVYPLRQLTAVDELDYQAFRQRFGFVVRVGAGGLWGVFGLLWGRRAGRVAAYFSRHDALLLLTFSDGRMLLISPQHAQRLRRVLLAGIDRKAS
jgi:hypothetical protein